MISLICTILGLLVLQTVGQRVAPGVPPQQYMQHQQVPQNIPNQAGMQQQVPIQQGVPGQVPVHAQVQQGVPMHQGVPMQQGVPVQQGVPMQQGVPVQQGVPMQQGVPVQQGVPAQHQQILNTANIAHEKDHIKEHMEVPIDTSKMTEQELQFHYFKMHDADNNDKLDGCELIKSLIHWHEQGHRDPNNHGAPHPGEKLFKDEELVNLIDPILSMDDLNNDGFIDYPEFVQAQQKSSSGTGRH